MTLLEEIAAGESFNLEFKLVPNEDRAKYLKTVVAFANGMGGRLLFGVGNDRKVVGIAASSVFAETDAIVNSITNGCRPRVPVEVCIENIDGKSVIVIDVLAGSGCPYWLKAEGEKDGVYVRVGATTQRADDATRHELTLAGEGRSFDSEPCPGAKIDDQRIEALCASMYRIARGNCRNEAERRTVKRVTVDQLLSWEIVGRARGRWIANNAYAILSGDPAFGARVKCGLFKGDTKAVFLDKRDFTGPVYKQIEAAHEYILSKINMGCVFEGIQRRDLYELPPDALRELVVNAFVHRNWFERDAPIFVAVYDTKVEIVSPGGLPRGLTAEKALAGRSKIRNRALAEAFNYMKVIERWGSGLSRVSDDLSAYGAKPLILEDSGIDVRAVVFRNGGVSHDRNDAKSASFVGLPLEKHRGNIGEASEKHRGNIGEASEKHFQQNDFELNETQKKILALISNDAGLSAAKLSAEIGISRRNIEVNIRKLRDVGILERRGSPKGGRWEICQFGK